MVDSTIKAKLVRCPKCENLLAEPQDCSFFKCGGCGAILCAKNKKREADSVSVNSMEDKSKDTSVNFSLTEPSSHSETPLTHQENGDSDSSSSGLDRLKKRSDFEGFRFSNSNYFPDSLSNEAIGQDRAGLVRKLDKLKDQFVESCNVATDKAPLPFSSSGKHMSGPSYYNPEPEPPCLYNQAHVDPVRFQIHGRTPHQSHQFYSGQYIGNNNQVLFDTHLQNGMFHQPSCSCFRCYDQFRRVSSSMLHPTGVPDALHNPGFYHQERNLEFGTLHSPRTFTPPPPGSQTRGHGGWPSEFGDVQRNGISRIRHLSKGLSSSGCRKIHPLAGGAPFITCQNCFKLLKLPEKRDAATNKQRKLRCGACSCLIEYSIVDNKLIVSTDLTSASKPEIDWVAANFSSDDYDNAAYEFHQRDVSTGSASISDTAQEMQILDSTSASLSEDELSLDSPRVQPVPSDLLHQEHDRSGAGSRSSRSEQDRVMVNKTVTRGNSMKESSVATEMDVSFNEYSHNNAVSQDPANDQGRTKKSGLASIVKKSLKDLTKSERSRGEFSINGHPVAERLVKTAEKQAGPIQPGNYWYDYRAGFWGVMGGPCLGILPPFIEELNYPMPENCSGGTTGIFVNGRELHQKDLRLLAARGLPRDRDRSYTVYITGRVIDEDTGEELDSLGKLAPTVDKMKRGFGMKVPRRAA